MQPLAQVQVQIQVQAQMSPLAQVQVQVLVQVQASQALAWASFSLTMIFVLDFTLIHDLFGLVGHSRQAPH